MAVTATFYGNFWTSLARKEVDFAFDTIKTMLTTSSYTPDRDAHRYKSSVTNEVAGTGYAAGGLTLASSALVYDSVNHRLRFTAGNAAWSGATITGARRAVVYDATPSTDATRPLIMWVDFGQDLSPVNGTISLTWDAIGLGYVG